MSSDEELPNDNDITQGERANLIHSLSDRRPVWLLHDFGMIRAGPNHKVSCNRDLAKPFTAHRHVPLISQSIGHPVDELGITTPSRALHPMANHQLPYLGNEINNSEKIWVSSMPIGCTTLIIPFSKHQVSEDWTRTDNHLVSSIRIDCTALIISFPEA